MPIWPAKYQTHLISFNFSQSLSSEEKKN